MEADGNESYISKERREEVKKGERKEVRKGVGWDMKRNPSINKT